MESFGLTSITHKSFDQSFENTEITNLVRQSVLEPQNEIIRNSKDAGIHHNSKLNSNRFYIRAQQQAQSEYLPLTKASLLKLNNPSKDQQTKEFLEKNKVETENDQTKKFQVNSNQKLQVTTTEVQLQTQKRVGKPPLSKYSLSKFFNDAKVQTPRMLDITEKIQASQKENSAKISIKEVSIQKNKEDDDSSQFKSPNGSHNPPRSLKSIQSDGSDKQIGKNLNIPLNALNSPTNSSQFHRNLKMKTQTTPTHKQSQQRVRQFDIRSYGNLEKAIKFSNPIKNIKSLSQKS